LNSFRTMLRGKIHRATVTEADVHYVGSISIDEDLMDAAGLIEYEQVHVAGLGGGDRLVTYVIKGARGSGTIGINGAAALRIHKGEKVIIFSYGQFDDESASRHEPSIVFVDEANHIISIDHSEEHGTIVQ